MTFVISKLSWPLLQPLGLLLLLLLSGAALSWTRWWRAGRRLVGLAALLALGLGVLPVGPALLAVLEQRFPRPDLPESVDGIIVLGGAIDARAWALTGRPALNQAAERMTEAVMLARRYPGAPLVFSGGSGMIFDPDLKEAPAALMLWRELGVDPGRIVLEDQSRDTWENAVMCRDLVQPQPGERWLLVTSAFHMPRAIGVFRALDWDVLPYPVDHRADPEDVRPGLGRPFDAARWALHEWLGLVVYRITGRIASLFPGPAEQPSLAPSAAAVAQHRDRAR